jgi:hypothetical protein
MIRHSTAILKKLTDLQAQCNRKFSSLIFILCTGMHFFQQIGVSFERKADAPICWQHNTSEIISGANSASTGSEFVRHRAVSTFCSIPVVCPTARTLCNSLISAYWSTSGRRLSAISESAVNRIGAPYRGWFQYRGTICQCRSK